VVNGFMLKRIFEKSALGLLIFKSDKVIDCNNAFVKMFCYENKQQIINIPPCELSPKFQPDGSLSIEKYNKAIQMTFESGFTTFEWIHLRANGESFWVEVSLTDVSEGDERTILGVLQEIGNKKRLEEKNSYQTMILDSVINSSIDLIFYKDYMNENGRYIGCNAAFEAFVGRTKEEIVGYNDIEIFGEELGLFFRDKDRAVIKSREGIANEEWVTYPNGEEILLHTTKSLFKDKEKKIIGILGISRDITLQHQQKTKLKKMAEKQKQLANIDSLTGINNRRAILKLSDKILKISQRAKQPFSLLMLDIDFFKDVNDIHGHLVGDDILKHFVETINTRLRESDVFGRYGGEEFIILLPNTNLKGSLEIAKDIRSLISLNIYVHDQAKIPITTSIGICQYTNEKSISDLIEKADAALYKAKENGRNRVEIL
jgi:diguanylate cyclase (GGDEF)-like protein/PAS domain S-box-containing protein